MWRTHRVFMRLSSTYPLHWPEFPFSQFVPACLVWSTYAIQETPQYFSFLYGFFIISFVLVALLSEKKNYQYVPRSLLSTTGIIRVPFAATLCRWFTGSFWPSATSQQTRKQIFFSKVLWDVIPRAQHRLKIIIVVIITCTHTLFGVNAYTVYIVNPNVNFSYCLNIHQKQRPRRF